MMSLFTTRVEKFSCLIKVYSIAMNSSATIKTVIEEEALCYFIKVNEE